MSLIGQIGFGKLTSKTKKVHGLMQVYKSDDLAYLVMS